MRPRNPASSPFGSRDDEAPTFSTCPSCSDCEYYQDSGSGGRLCWHPKTAIKSPIFGNLPNRVERARSYSGACGLDGKLFERRHTFVERLIAHLENFFLGRKR